MIEVKHLSKSFKVVKKNAGIYAAFKSFFKPNTESIHALKNISFNIEPGEIVGYIGPNGAGKSTTIKVMSGILTPDSGACTINGLTPWTNRIEHVKNIGVVFGQRSQLWWDIPVIDSFDLLKDIYKISEGNYDYAVQLLSDILSIEDLLETPVRQLSLGQRMRCEIAASLLHNPKILFLDEPTIGLDAISKIAVRDFIKQINKSQKTTVILTTHDMHDIEALTDRIILIGKGEVLFDGLLSTIKNKYITHKTITIDHHQDNFILSHEGVELIEQSTTRMVMTVDIRNVAISDVITYLAKNLDVIDITVDDPSLEDIMVQMYKAYNI